MGYFRKFFNSFFEYLAHWLPLIVFFLFFVFYLRDNFVYVDSGFSLASAGDPIVFGVALSCFVSGMFLSFLWYYFVDFINFIFSLFSKLLCKKSADQKVS